MHIWHGDLDTNVPVAMAQHVAAQIPGSSLTIYPGEGHRIVPKHWNEITSALVSADPLLPLGSERSRLWPRRSR